jgi:alanine racemase
VANLAILRELGGADTPIHPVVKGDAYGHGAIPVTEALERAGADGFCVATMDEALALRAAGISRPIVVLYPTPPSLAARARAADIAITAGDMALLAPLIEAVQATTGERPLGVHLVVESGLGRGGFRGEELAAAAQAIDDEPALRLAGIWTHLQAPEDAPRTAGQMAEFERALAMLEAQSGLRVRPRHVAASGGLLVDGVDAFDGTRPGLVLYGLIPDELLPRLTAGGAPGTSIRVAAAQLQPILSLYARPVGVNDLPAGWGISYGPSFTTSRPSRIATLPLGYGDGWARALSNRASALVRGQRVPLVGNVAMDAVMADVTEVPGPPITVDDEFVLIGAQGDERITVAEVAAARGTNSWEAVTALAQRLPRVYHAASAPRETRTLVDDGERRRPTRP